MLSESERALARAVLIHGPISRSELTSRLGLSPPSLTRLAKPFLDRGLLIELDDRTDGSVGRPVRPLDVRPGLAHFAGVKITGESLHVVATDVRAGLLAYEEHRLERRDPEGVAAEIARAVRGLGVDRLAGVGVSLGGAVRDGRVEFAPFLDWTDVPFAALVEAELGVPASIENDLVALAEAERWFGMGRGIPGFVVITIGAGIGYALVVNGQAVHSREAGVGLGGHIPLGTTGPVCHAGHRGCAEAMLTSGSIASQVSAALQRPVDYDEVLRLAALGDPAAATVVDEAAAALGRLVAMAVNLTLQPAAVLAGEGIALFSLAEERVRAAIAADRDPRAEPVQLFVDESGFSAWARGAATIAIQDAVDRIDLDQEVQDLVPASAATRGALA
ncbi:ROK family transcriptional regulator [Cellulomonas sp. Root137]|uniref:ROK family transcriptional regulator n=1 Tax=Cellulomonas sp. Root137 TaxID=1736459 RepID=UPI0006F94D26|nr:ROK family transcriptional regulator [Cellulomonas sp. Root137]KQY41959.1 MarR family transcriptional regulator [Cellulomonas sp. Root137]KRD41217.1 MarR family transcriptional regulator [Cellulomonas sp. Root930]